MTIHLVGQSALGVLGVVEVDPQTDPRWEAFVAAHPDGLIYHHPAWLQVLEKVYGYKPTNLACEDAAGQMRGVLPLFHTRGLVTGRGLACLPRTPVAGPLAVDDEAAAALLQAAVERVRQEPRACLQLKMPSAKLDGLVQGVVGTPWELTYVLELPKRPEDLHFGDSRNHGRIKWAVNKAAKLGVQIRPAETEDELRAWYELYLDTMRWHAVPARPYRFFKAGWELLRPRGLMRLLLAEQHDAGQRKLLAGSIFLMFGHTVFYAYNGRRREDLAVRPNDAIQWRAIHDACREGYRRYDFGAVVEDNQGLVGFKSKWAAEPRRVYKYHYPPPREVEQVPLEAEPGAFESHNYIRQFRKAAWRRLPLKATAVLGDWIFSYL